MKKIAFLLAIVMSLSCALCSCTSTPLKTSRLPEGLELDTSELATRELETQSEIYYEKDFPLVVRLPKEKLYIYDVRQPGFSGVLVRFGNTVSWFNWTYLSGTDLPQAAVGDYDADGEEEVAVAFAVSKGMTNYNEDLHVLKYVDGELSDFPYFGTTLATEVGANIIIQEKEEKSGVYTISSPNEKYDVDFSEMGNYQSLYFSAKNDFTVDKTITARVGIGFVIEGVELPVYLGYSAKSTISFIGNACIAEVPVLEKDESEATSVTLTQTDATTKNETVSQSETASQSSEADETGESLSKAD